MGEKYSYAESQVFNPFINQNIEFNLFEYNFISAVRKVKGMLTYKLFNRASGDVVISDDGSQLYLKETVDDKNTKSAFNPVDDSEIENIVQTLNAISQHYKAEGFDQVYFSMIPNPVTAIEPDNKYNHIIARIENNPVLEINTISVLNDFSKAGKSVYRPGDTHWNDSGMQMWLRKVNESLNAR